MMRRTALALAAFTLGSVCLLACIGGTGTDTEDDIKPSVGGLSLLVLDARGKAMPGVTLEFHSALYRPDLAGADSVAEAPAGGLRTDSSGLAKPALRGPGVFVVEGRRGDTALFFDTVAVTDVEAVATRTVVAGTPGKASGHIRLASGLRLDSALIFIRGTSRTAAIDSAGRYDLGTLPPDFASMALGVAYRSAARDGRFAEQVKAALTHDTLMTGPRKDTTAVFKCREVSPDSAARLALASAAPGSGTGSGADTGSALGPSEVKAVGRACDSLQAGTVITVKIPKSGPVSTWAPGDSVTVSLIAYPGDGKSGLRAEKSLLPIRCVESAGSAALSFALKPEAGSATDFVLGDVAEACLESIRLQD